VELQMTVLGSARRVGASVVRCGVAMVTPRLLYRVGVRFEDPLTVDPAGEQGDGYQLPEAIATRTARPGIDYPSSRGRPP
jgi:hypothetical protein